MSVSNIASYYLKLHAISRLIWGGGGGGGDNLHFSAQLVLSTVCVQFSNDRLERGSHGYRIPTSSMSRLIVIALTLRWCPATAMQC